MTLFEYLSVAASIVLALGVGRLVSGAPSVFASGKRDWLHANFVVLLLLLHLFQWWRLWPLHEVSSWTFLHFLIVIGSPIFLYLAAHVLIPDAPGEVEAWGQYFIGAHRWFFAALACNVLCGILRIVFVLELDARPLIMASYLAPPVVGVLVSNRKVIVGLGILAWLQTLYLIQSSFVAGSYSL